MLIQFVVGEGRCARLAQELFTSNHFQSGAFPLGVGHHLDPALVQDQRRLREVGVEQPA